MTGGLERREYRRGALDEAEMDADPIRQIQLWLEAARAAGVPDADAMTLATATPDGRPSARLVLLKAVDRRGLTFYTSFESRKGGELAANPRAATVFYWPDLERQVRVEGTVERLPEAESDAYFRSRPPGARLGALASRQSQVIPSREVLAHRVRELRRQFPDGDAPRPPWWGGYLLVPEALEFWQGRPDRLNDRLRYRRMPDGGWLLERLAP
jgi:pyridoxamine 5'-phosphate oxidase